MGLKKICIRRYIKPEGFDIIKESSLHHFSDTSEEGYGQSSYLRLVNATGKIHCCLFMRKSSVTPKNYLTISYQELLATSLPVKIAALIRKEIDIEWKNETFSTDSKVVLGYTNIIIPKSSKYLLLTEYSRYMCMREAISVNGNIMNPADDVSEGLDANKNTSSSEWFKAQEFFDTMKLLGQ